MKKLIFLFQVLFPVFCVSGASAHEPDWLSSFSRIPVMEEGRIKPMDTYARSVLLQLSGKDHYAKRSACAWLANLVFQPEAVSQDKIFLINHPDIPAALSIKADAHRRYSFDQLHEHFEKLFELAQGASAIEEKQRSVVENEILRVFGNVQLYINLSVSFKFVEGHEDFAIRSLQTAQALGMSVNEGGYSFLDIALKAGEMHKLTSGLETKDKKQWTASDREIMTLARNLFSWSNRFDGLPLHILPSARQEIFLTPWEALTQQFVDPVIHEEVIDLAQAAAAYRDKQTIEVDLALKKFSNSVSGRMYASGKGPLERIGLELMYQRLKPFDLALILFLTALILLFVSTFGKWNWIDPVLWGLMALGAGLNLAGVIIRCIILSRPPVSSLYETFIFVSLIAVICALLIEFIQKNRLGFLIGAISSSALLMIASKYSAEGDTLKMLIAVLNSNFWLGTHVITISAGYGVTCVAAVLGHVWLVQKALRQETRVLEATMTAMLSVMGVALILTFFGTNLGGIWADQSWGRFWGWDPKENGALMIVLWLIFLFHAKWAELIGPVGLSAGNVISLIVVMWAWFGVNLLSIGLHSYGFTSGVASALLIYAVCEIVFLIVTLAVIGCRNKANR